MPGFVASRLQMALLREALWLVENEVASAEDVDIAISAGLGRRWATAGVLHVLEVAGWDLISRVAADVFPHLSNAADCCTTWSSADSGVKAQGVLPSCEDDPSLLHDMVERGDSGVKAGKGFYELDPGWRRAGAKAYRLRSCDTLIEIDKLD